MRCKSPSGWNPQANPRSGIIDRRLLTGANAQISLTETLLAGSTEEWPGRFEFRPEYVTGCQIQQKEQRNQNPDQFLQTMIPAFLECFCGRSGVFPRPRSLCGGIRSERGNGVAWARGKIAIRRSHEYPVSPGKPDCFALFGKIYTSFAIIKKKQL
jgi:hypothetical protein